MIGALIPNVLIPTLLALTLRVALKKSQSPQVPPLPQFYEDANTGVHYGTFVYYEGVITQFHHIFITFDIVTFVS